MARIELKIEFENPEWQPIEYKSLTSDKNAYRIWKLIQPKKADFKPNVAETETKTAE